MGQTAPRTIADRVQGFSDLTISDLRANLTLEPSNYVQNWRFEDLNLDNDPEGWGDGIRLPEDPDGVWIFMSDKDAGQNTMAAQDTAPWDIDSEFASIDTPYVTGHSPKTKTFAAGIAPPVFFGDYVEIIQSTKNGFKAGTYLASYTFIKKQGKGGGRKKRKHKGGAVYLHTQMSPVVSFTVGQSQHIRFLLPDAPEGVTHIGIWLSRPAGGISTMRLQEIVGVKNRVDNVYILRGPYRSRRSPSNENEHRRSKRKRPTGRKRRGTRRGRRGRYRARVIEIDNETGSFFTPSDWSDWVELTTEDIENEVAIEFDPEATGVVSTAAESFPYELEVQREDLDTLAMEDFVYVNPDGVGGTTILDFVSDTSAIQAGRDSGGRAPQISGRTEDEDSSSQLKSGRSGPLRKRRTTDTSTSATSEEEDRIEDPDSPFESAVGIGKTLITPGSYWFATSYAVRGEETMRSAAFKKSISTGQTFKIRFPSSINILKNSQWNDIDADGNPDGWSITGADVGNVNHGTATVDAETHEMILSTSGLKNNFPTQFTPNFSQEISVNQGDRWTFGGELNAFVTAGNVEAYVEQLGTDGTVLATNYLKQLSYSADVEFGLTFGPGYIAWNTSTDRVRLGVRFSGAARNATARVQELYGMPFERKVRRRSKPHRGSRRHHNSRPKVFVRWEKQSDKGVELPPTKIPVAQQFVPLDRLDFAGGTITGTGWTLAQDSTSGVVAQVQPAPAPAVTNGFRFTKTTAGLRSQYLWKTFTPSTRTRLAVHLKIRVFQQPTTNYVDLLSIDNTQQNYGAQRGAYISLGSAGDLWYVGRESGGDEDWYELSSGITSGTILDLELLISDGGTAKGSVQAAVGKNGATRTFSNIQVGQYWPTHYPRHVHAGPYNHYSSSTLYDFFYESVVVTESGDLVGETGTGTGLEPFSTPDRPYMPVTPREVVGFEANAIPTPWTAVTAGTATVAVQAASNTAGTYGLRCSETGTSTSGSAMIQQLFSTLLNSEGIRGRIRVVTLPNTGTVRVLRVASATNNTLGYFTINSSGQLHAVSGNGGGSVATPVLVGTGITNGTVVTLEITFTGGASDNGILSFWASYGGTGAIGERRIYHQAPQSISGAQVGRVQVGIVFEDSASTTCTLDVDEIVRTERGEVLFSEFDSQSREIYQVNYFLPPESPLRDDLMNQDVRIAAKPNETYTFAIKCRNAGVVEMSYPFLISAYDTLGEEHVIGDVYQNYGGCLGTMSWADRYLTFIVPAGCYEIRINSRSMGTGEWTYQEPLFERGAYTGIRDVTYPVQGQHQVILDTVTGATLPWLNLPAKNVWLANGAVYSVPTGCSMVAEYASSNSITTPTAWYTDPGVVPPARYGHYRFTMTSDSTRTLSPEVSAGSPFVDYYTDVAGMPIPVLLRGDFSEFPGGVHLQDISFPSAKSRWDVREPQGKAIRHRLTEPVGFFSGFSIVAHTEEAMAEIEERYLEEEFCVEAFGRRFTVKFKDIDGLKFSVEQKTLTWTNEPRWYGRGAASTGEVEIVSIDPMPGDVAWRPEEVA